MSLVATCAWVLLVAAQVGWFPGSRFAWAFGLWRYLPHTLSVALAGLSLALCHRSVRTALVDLAGRAGSGLARLPQPARAVLLTVGVALSLWALRERQLSGDSPLLLLAVRHGYRFVFPDTGATWLLGGVVALADHLAVRPGPAAQSWSCIWGGLTVLLLAGAAKHLAPRNGPTAAMLLLSGGLLRVFAGHVETYPVLLAMAAAYLWGAFSHLSGRTSLAAPCLALGGAVWVHASALCLVPSLAWLLWNTPHEAAARLNIRRVALGLALTALPMTVFIGTLLATEGTGALADALAKANEILGQSSDPAATRWWVRGFGGEPSIGTDVVLLSRAQLKYLINAAHLLTPVALPVIAAIGVAAPRALVATPGARFLSIACAPMVLYAFALRPFWGPYDWDLFSLSALMLSALAAHLLALRLDAGEFRSVGVVLIGLAWLFVTLPFLTIGAVEVREAGPFAVSFREYDTRKPLQPAPDWLTPWL